MTAAHDRDDATPTPEEEAVERRLRHIAEHMHADLADAERMESAPGEDKVEAVLEGLWGAAGEASDAPPTAGPTGVVGGEQGSATRAESAADGPRGAEPSGPTSPRRMWVALVAAALVIVIAKLFLPDDDPDRDLMLGSDEFGIVAPVGVVDTYSEVVWTHPSAEDVSFQVEVYDRDPTSGATSIATSETLTNRDRWALPPTVESEGRIWIDVTVSDLDGRFLDSKRVEAWRR